MEASAVHVRSTHGWLIHRAAPNALCPRELLVLEALLDGVHEEDIASVLGIARGQTARLRRSALRKLEVASLPDLVRLRAGT
mgnify:CR=1 FL=1